MTDRKTPPKYTNIHEQTTLTERYTMYGIPLDAQTPAELAFWELQRVLNLQLSDMTEEELDKASSDKYHPAWFSRYLFPAHNGGPKGNDQNILGLIKERARAQFHKPGPPFAKPEPINNQMTIDSLAIAQMSGLSNSILNTGELYAEGKAMVDTDYEKTLCNSLRAKAVKLTVSDDTKYYTKRLINGIDIHPNGVYEGGWGGEEFVVDLIGKEFAFLLKSTASVFPEMADMYKVVFDLKQKSKPMDLSEVTSLELYVAIKVCVLCLRSPAVSNPNIRDAILWGHNFTAALQTLLGEAETRDRGYVIPQAEWDEFNDDLFKPRWVWAILN